MLFTAKFRIVALAAMASCWLNYGLGLAWPAEKTAAPEGVKDSGSEAPVWTCDILDQNDGGTKGAPLVIRLTGARNGSFSGKAVVGAGGAVEASISALKGEGGALIPASQVWVRYGAPWPNDMPAGKDGFGHSYKPKGLDILLDKPPQAPPAGRAAVWVTVAVPKQAPAGKYTGSLTLSGAQKATVPVELKVADWTLPDPQEYRTWVELIQSPDTLALEYNLPLWSDKHWEMIAKSFSLISGTGSRVLYTPILAHSNMGNEQAMVRWAKKGDNYEYDFSIMDKYLDLAEKSLGKPKIVCFNVWDSYLLRPDGGACKWFYLENLSMSNNKGPLVTEVDGTGKAQNITLPDYPFRENITVGWVYPRPGAAFTSVEAYAQNDLAEMQKNLADLKECEKGSATVNGQEARWTIVTYSQGPFKLKALKYLLVQGESQKPPGKIIVLVTGLSRLEKFDEYKSLFVKTAQSCKADGKDIAIEFPADWDKASRAANLKGSSGLDTIAWSPKEPAAAPNPVHAAWKLLFDQLRERLAKRGLDKAMMLGMCTDWWPSKAQVEFLKDVSGNLPWVNSGHYVRPSLYDKLAEYGYQSSFFDAMVYGCPYGAAPHQSHYGWNRATLDVLFPRTNIDSFPALNWRVLPELCITGTVRGVGRVGADNWLVVRDKRGERKARVCERFCSWGLLNCDDSALAPGPDGPLATVRLEALREGVQESEALISLERVLLDKKLKDQLGAELSKRCEDALSERREATPPASANERLPGVHPDDYAKFSGSGGWQARSEKLYSLAGEVAKKLGK